MGLTDYTNGTTAVPAVPGANGANNFISSVQAYVNQISLQYVITPKGLKGIAGYVFDYEGEDRLSMESDITDHFAENNTAIQDHIANKPKMLTLRGFASELVLPGIGVGVFGELELLEEKLGTTDAYLGKYTPQGLQKLQGAASAAVNQVQNYANTAAQYLNQAKNIAQLFGGGAAAPTKQAQAYQTLGALRDSFQVFSVVTPWTVLPSMAITSLVFVQPKDNKQMSDIIVTMKEMRFIDTVSGNLGGTYAGRAASMYAAQTAGGSSALTSVTPQAYLASEF